MSIRSKSSPVSSAKLKSVMLTTSGGSIIRCRAVEPHLIDGGGPIAGSVRAPLSFLPALALRQPQDHVAVALAKAIPHQAPVKFAVTLLGKGRAKKGRFHSI
jgi:hypothetical protein